MKHSSSHCLLGALLVLPLAVSASGATADEADFPYPPTISLDSVRQYVDRASTQHPRLLATTEDFVALREALSTDPARQALADAVVKQAELLRSVPPVERKLQGRRLLGQSRRCVKRVLTLAMAYQLTGDPRHVERCQQEMLAAARFSDWNPSHFLDVAEMTFALAVGYDWLYEQLDESSRVEIRSAIVAKGVLLPFETRHKGWVNSRNNWGQVCHGGLTAGALAVMEDEPDLAARTVHNALHHVTRSMDAFSPNGGYPEGPGYWSYGTSYNVTLIGVLESVLGTDFGLGQAPGFRLTGQYVSLMCGPSGVFFNYADGGAGRSVEPTLFWFASRSDRPDWLLGEEDRLLELLRREGGRSVVSDGNRLLPLALLWMDGRYERTDIGMPLHWCSEGETPVTVHRSSWTDPAAVFVGLKAGSPSASHGQMDIGSFVLDADGVRWAVDLGAEGYHGIESRGMNLWGRSQDSDRWTIFRQRNDGHNTLVIDGQLQRASGNGRIVAFSGDPEHPYSIVDMSSVYEGQADTVQRGVMMIGAQEVVIQDQLSGLRPGSRVRWGMITPGTPETLGESSVTLNEDDAQLMLTIQWPQAAVWQVIDTAKPRNEWDSPNRGTRMVAFEAIAPASGQMTLAVIATPGTCKDSVTSRLELRPLQEWKDASPVP